MTNNIEPASLPLSLLALLGIITLVGSLSMWAVCMIASTRRFKTNGLPASPAVSLQTNLAFLGVLVIGLALVAPALMGSNL